jgi:hypothetical protein
VAVVAVAMGLPPREVWDMDPQDLATVVDVLEEQSRRR